MFKNFFQFHFLELDNFNKSLENTECTENTFRKKTEILKTTTNSDT